MKPKLKLHITPLDTSLVPDTIHYSSFDSPKVNMCQSYKWNKHLLSPKLRVVKFKIPSIARENTPPTATATHTGENSLNKKNIKTVTFTDEDNASSPIDFVRISFPMSP